MELPSVKRVKTRKNDLSARGIGARFVRGLLRSRAAFGPSRTADRGAVARDPLLPHQEDQRDRDQAGNNGEREQRPVRARIEIENAVASAGPRPRRRGPCSRWKPYTLPRVCGVAQAASIASRGAPRTPFPTRSNTRIANTCRPRLRERDQRARRATRPSIRRAPAAAWSRAGRPRGPTRSFSRLFDRLRRPFDDAERDGAGAEHLCEEERQQRVDRLRSPSRWRDSPTRAARPGAEREWAVSGERTGRLGHRGQLSRRADRRRRRGPGRREIRGTRHRSNRLES